MISGFQPIPRGQNEALWKAHFSPRDFVLQNQDIDINTYRMDTKTLMSYGVYISRVREKVYELAKQLDDLRGPAMGLMEQEVSRIKKKMTRWG